MSKSLLDLAARAQYRKDMQVTPTMQATAYSSGNVMGGIQTITTQDEAKLSDILQSVVVYDASAQSSQLDIFIFSALPAATYTDGTAFAPSNADMLNCIGVVNVAAADYVAAGTGKSIAAGKNEAMIGRVVKPSNATTQTNNSGAATSLYAVAVSRGTPTYAAGLSLSFRYQWSQGL
jgi:hypothetical protein